MRRAHFLIVIATAFCNAACTQAQELGLLAWWKLDEGTGTIAYDSSGNGNDGTFVGDPEWVAGKFGSGLLFDGKGGERVSLGSLDVSAAAISITCWFNAYSLDTPGNDPRMISKAVGGNEVDHWWMLSSGRQSNEKRLRFRLKTSSGSNTTTLIGGQGTPEERVLPVNEWTHAAATWDGTTMRVYLNAIETGSVARGGTAVAVDPTVPAAFGNQPIGAENRPFDGIIDDVRIYARALTVEEIQQVMAGPPAPLAAGPDPANGALVEQSWYNLSWKAGTWATSHDVYLGTSFEDVNSSAAGTFIANTTSASQIIGIPGFPVAEGLQPGTTYYWRVDEVNPARTESPWKGVIWSFTLPPRTAYNPFPPDTMKFVDTNVKLSWTAKWNAALYNVYFGTDPVQVENAAGAASSGQTTFDPGPLQLETTYYWRVDLFDRLEWRKGDVWSFTTMKSGGGLVGEYANYGGGVPDPPESPFQNVALTRIDPGINFNWGNGSPAPNVIDADNFAVRWTGELEVPLTGTYVFKTTTDDGVLLYVNGQEMADAWRNQSGALEQSGTIDLVAGEFASIKMLYFATTGSAQADLRWTHDLFPETVIPAAALSPPLRAGLVKPTNQAVNVSQTPSLEWTSGNHAVQHDVYFGRDAAAVAAADTSATGIYQGRQAVTSFSPPKLEWDTTYYWRIDEVNDAHADSPWKGSVWSFTTANFLIIDDFEDYDAYDNQIWWTWKDGLGYAAHDNQPAYAGNGTGSAAGDDTTVSYTEETLRHSGSQSMPLFYDNNKVGYAKYSEAEMALTSSRDWTEGGVTELSLWFLGNPANSAERLYVAVSNATGNPAVVYHVNPNATQTDSWQEWVIPLQSFATLGTNLANVDRIAIGIGTRGNTTIPGGMGKILIDDIRLYRPRTP